MNDLLTFEMDNNENWTMPVAPLRNSLRGLASRADLPADTLNFGLRLIAELDEGVRYFDLRSPAVGLEPSDAR